MKKSLVAFFVAAIVGGLPQVAEAALTPEKRVKALCRGEIKSRLKYPDSAEFGASYVQEVAGEWTVLREVKAKNSFGMAKQNVFTCTFRASGDTFTLVRFK